MVCSNTSNKSLSSNYSSLGGRLFISIHSPPLPLIAKLIPTFIAPFGNFNAILEGVETTLSFWKIHQTLISLRVSTKGHFLCKVTFICDMDPRSISLVNWAPQTKCQGTLHCPFTHVNSVLKKSAQVYIYEVDAVANHIPFSGNESRHQSATWAPIKCISFC